MSFRIDRNAIIQRPINPPKKEDIKNNKFEDVLNQTMGKTKEVKISSHAQRRMLERGINLQKKDLENISKAMDSLEGKQAKESLILYRDMAFITSVKNRTIITAIEEKDMDIVTNIDSAVIVK